MMKVLTLVFLSTLAILANGCDGNYVDVKVSGVISDEVSGNSIADARVTVQCWVYDTEIWESKTVEKSTTTDSNGKFTIDFKKGEALDIVVKSEEYLEYQESVTLKKNTHDFVIKLKK